MVTVRAGTAELWAWLGEVADPEIPVISIVDLGIVRAVEWKGDTCVVTITPTYSGCPAMAVIAHSVTATLAAHGVDQVRLVSQLSPAWTTDAISAAGKLALKGYGIAPPAGRAVDVSGLRRGAAPKVACPNCGSMETSLLSQFGSTPCKALYSCRACREPFDYFKPH